MKTIDKWFTGFIQILIIASAVSFAFETLPDLTSKQRMILEVFEVVIVIIFTFEYVVRIYQKGFKFIFSFYGIIDLIAILPFYISTGIDLRSIRIFRLLRLFRLLKFVRYIKAIDHFKTAFKSMKEEFIVFFTVTMFLMYLSGVGIYYFENAAQPENIGSIFDGIWWAIITLTTVGYGDVYPITVGGKIFTFIILLLSLGIVAVPTGLVASSLSKLRDENNLN